MPPPCPHRRWSSRSSPRLRSAASTGASRRPTDGSRCPTCWRGPGGVGRAVVLERAGTVRGVVRTAQDDPAGHTPVALQCLAGLASPYFGGYFSTTTNDLGAYTIADVPACTFRASASNDARER